MSSGAVPAILNFPFSGIDIFSTKIDRKTSVIGESHIIPLNSPYQFYLNYVPLQQSPTTIFIPGYTETTSAPGSFQFNAIYSGTNAGLLIFNSLQSGVSVTVNYTTYGDVIRAEYINSLQTAVNNIETFISGGVPVSGDFVQKTGDTMSGTLTLQGPGTDLNLINANITTTAASLSDIATFADPFNSAYITNLNTASITSSNATTVSLNSELVLNSGVNISMDSSGSNQIGDASLPLGTLYVDNLVAKNLSGLSTGLFVKIFGDTMYGDLELTNSSSIRLWAGGINAPTATYASIASGYFSIASGYSMALGYAAKAITDPLLSTGSSIAVGSAPTAIDNSAAFGLASLASGTSFAANTYTKAFYNSAAFGNHSKALGQNSFAEGYYTIASGNNSHAEGYQTQALGNVSHTEGYASYASGYASHSEGYSTADADFSHAEGVNTWTQATASHAEGSYTLTQGYASHAEGVNTLVIGDASHSEGYDTQAIGNYGAHAEGDSSQANANSSHAEGYNTQANGNGSHAEGDSSQANGNYSHAEGSQNISTGVSSHVEGFQSSSNGSYSHAEGYNTITNGQAAHSEGQTTLANGYASHTEGVGSIANASSAHAEGTNTEANGTYSHAEGYYTKTYGDNSHSQGLYTLASGQSSFAGGEYSEANGYVSVALGYSGIANADGSWTLKDGDPTYSAINNSPNSLLLSFSNGVSLNSGTNIYAKTSGTQTIGSSTNPFLAVYANNFVNVSGNSLYLLKAGDTMTGNLNFAAGTKITGLPVELKSSYSPSVYGRQIVSGNYIELNTVDPVANAKMLMAPGTIVLSSKIPTFQGTNLAIVGNGNIFSSGNIIPASFGSHSLGLLTLPWSGVYTNKLSVTEISTPAPTYGPTEITVRNPIIFNVSGTTVGNSVAFASSNIAIPGSGVYNLGLSDVPFKSVFANNFVKNKLYVTTDQDIPENYGIVYTNQSAPITLTLPKANDNLTISIIDISNSASLNNVFIQAYSGDTINNVSGLTMNISQNGAAMKFFGASGNWIKPSVWL